MLAIEPEILIASQRGHKTLGRMPISMLNDAKMTIGSASLSPDCGRARYQSQLMKRRLAPRKITNTTSKLVFAIELPPAVWLA